MPVRSSAGVYVNEIDKSFGTANAGNGGIGIAVKVNKGPVGKPFTVTSGNKFLEACGKPMPGFNLMSWHSVDNILMYTDGVILSRAEKTEYNATHTPSIQMLEIPVNTAQVGVCLTGDTVNFDFSTELQMMVKNRTLFKSTNIRNVYDLLNGDKGIDLNDVDNAMLVDNDDTVELYTIDSAFNTKAKSLQKIANLGLKSVTVDDFVPEIEVGQVYDNNGKIVSIGNNIYSDHYIVHIQSGGVNTGSGTLQRDPINNIQLNGVDSAFTLQTRPNTSLDVKWFSPYFDSGVTIERNSSSYKMITATGPTGNDFKNLLSVGDKILVEGIERTIASVSGDNIFLTTDAPNWSGVTFSYCKQVTETVTVNKIMNDNILRTTSFINSTFSTVEAGGSNVTIESASESGTAFNIFSDGLVTNGLEVFSSNEFSSVYVDIDTVNSNTNALNVQYYTSDGVVANVKDFVDGTNSFTQSGYIYFTIDKSTAWYEHVTNGYGIRISNSFDYTAGSTTAPTANFIVPTVIPTETSSSFTYGYTEALGVETVVEQVYRDESDLTNKTLKGVNVNFHALLREGSKIVIDLGGGVPSYVRYVSEIVSPELLILTESFAELTIDAADAKTFTYHNFYFEGNTANIGSKIFTPNGEGVIVFQDEANTEGANYFKYVVKLVSGNINKGDKVCLSKLNEFEWDYFICTVKDNIDINKEDNLYMLGFSGDINFDTDDDTIFFNDDNSEGGSPITRDNYKGRGNVFFSSVANGEYGYMSADDKLVIVELFGTGSDGSPSTVKNGWLASTDSEHVHTEWDTDKVDYVLGDFVNVGEYIYELTDITDPAPTSPHAPSSGWNPNNNVATEDRNGTNYYTWTCRGDLADWDEPAEVADINFIHNYQDVIVYEHTEHDGDMVMVTENVNGMTDEIKERYTYTYNLNNDGTDKVSHIVNDSVTGNPITSTEFMRVCAITPGAWINDDNVSFTLCDMDHFDTALVEDNGIKISSLFEYPPNTDDKSLMALLIIKNDMVVEKYIISSDPLSKDDQNNSQFISDVVNAKSGLVRVFFNSGILTPNEPNGYDVHFNTIHNTMIEGGYSGKKLEIYHNYYYDDESTIEMEVVNGHVEDMDVVQAYDVFRSKEDVSLRYLVDGEWCGNIAIANRMMDICVDRGDSVALIGPKVSDILGIRDDKIIENNLVRYLSDNGLVGGGRTYQFMGFFGNIKQVYDIFNETYVWLPVSVDAVGLNRYVDEYLGPWYAVAGLTRGNIKNAFKLGWNPKKINRDELYPARVNPVVYFKGDGNVIYGVRSLCTSKSDLADIFNRKTLNHIEMNLEAMMRQVMFEFNDANTRGNVVSSIDPFLKNIKTKRGLIDYKLVCDESNNPMTIVEQDTLIIDIFLKMTHVIQQIELNFIITKASVGFDEVV